MKRVHRFLLFALLLAILPGGANPQSAKPARVAGNAPAEILRDEFGIPHVFATTLEDAAYAIGYAQAEDRLEELLKNYRKAEGTMSEAFGPDWFRHDYRQRMWRHAEISRALNRRAKEASRSSASPARQPAGSAFCSSRLGSPKLLSLGRARSRGAPKCETPGEHGARRASRFDW